METQYDHWLPLTEYALRSGMSISTLRRKIKSQTIEFKMEDGRYLIRSEDLMDSKTGFASSDQTIPQKIPNARPASSEIASTAVVASPANSSAAVAGAPAASSRRGNSQEIDALREEFRQLQEQNVLRWKALEARVAGLAKKLEFFTEQMAETKMLVKIFEEKLDHRA